MRQCGLCSLCCKLVPAAELEKPADQWCGYCKPGQGGCTVYDRRPAGCRDFNCGWLSGAVSDDWYPLRAHIVLTAGFVEGGIQIMTAVVDGRFAQAWRRAPYYPQLKQMATAGLAVERRDQLMLVGVRVEREHWLLLPDRDVKIDLRQHGLELRQIGPAQWEVEPLIVNCFGGDINLDPAPSHFVRD